MTESDQETTGRTVVGMFARRADAESAILELKAAGFGDDQIGVAFSEDGFDDDLRSGGALVTVSAGRRTDEALRVLQRHGVDLGSRATPAPAERRVSRDPAYAGPERRAAGV